MPSTDAAASTFSTVSMNDAIAIGNWMVTARRLNSAAPARAMPGCQLFTPPVVSHICSRVFTIHSRWFMSPLRPLRSCVSQRARPSHQRMVPTPKMTRAIGSLRVYTPAPRTAKKPVKQRASGRKPMRGSRITSMRGLKPSQTKPTPQIGA